MTTSLFAVTALIGAIALMGTLFIFIATDTPWEDSDDGCTLNTILVVLPVTVGIIGMIIVTALAIARG